MTTNDWEGPDVSGTVKIKRALVSVSNKTGVVALCRELRAAGVEILSTGGTARALTEAGVDARGVDSYTGQPEIMDGRVKTLHPRIHGAILAVRDNAEHRQQMDQHGIEPIDLVVVNLYPFERTIARPGVEIGEAIENIDIGGPCMVRSAAKNHAYVVVVVDPADYEGLLAEIRTGGVSYSTRKRLAVKAFGHTARYDTAIEKYLNGMYAASDS
jgi:phosphoribosylaminoimidazolecarboxamide formyltransferase / IMP cyclohydrolase